MRSLNKTNEEQNASSKELAAAVKTLEKNSKLGAYASLFYHGLSDTYIRPRYSTIRDAQDRRARSWLAGYLRVPHGKDEGSSRKTAERTRFIACFRMFLKDLFALTVVVDNIQVALFVTIITTFQSPVSQNLSPGPTDTTNAILGNLTMLVYEIAMLNGLQVPNRPAEPEPFSPDLTDQIVTMFWYSSLLFSVGFRWYLNAERF